MKNTQPMKLLQESRAKARALQDPSAKYCTLATLEETDSSQVRMRTLVVREITDESCLLFVNKNAQKNLHDFQSAKLEVLFFYPSLMAQFRLRGMLSFMPEEELKKRWQHKPYEAKLLDHYYAAYQSQSSSLTARANLMKGIDALKLKYPNQNEVPFVQDALGLIVKANYLEVWQGLDTGIHDRRLFTQSQNVWHEEVLVP